MPQSDPEKRRAYNADYYARNKEEARLWRLYGKSEPESEEEPDTPTRIRTRVDSRKRMLREEHLIERQAQMEYAEQRYVESAAAGVDDAVRADLLFHVPGEATIKRQRHIADVRVLEKFKVLEPQRKKLLEDAENAIVTEPPAPAVPLGHLPNADSKPKVDKPPHYVEATGIKPQGKKKPVQKKPKRLTLNDHMKGAETQEERVAAYKCYHDNPEATNMDVDDDKKKEEEDLPPYTPPTKTAN